MIEADKKDSNNNKTITQQQTKRNEMRWKKKQTKTKQENKQA